jgi:hypothetical protein
LLDRYAENKPRLVPSISICFKLLQQNHHFE